MDQGLRKGERLSNRADYSRCYRHGKRLRTPYFTVYAYRRGEGRSRLGLAVGRTVGDAVTRNRVKRRLRELFRRDKDLIPEGYDVFVRAQPASARAAFRELKVAWKEAFASLTASNSPQP